MLLRNLREPVWNSVPCDAKLLHFTICSVVEKTKSNYINGEDNLSELLKSKSINLLINNKCYGFLWNSWNTASQLCYNFKARVVSPSEFTSISHIFDAVSSINLFPLFIFPSFLNLTAIKIYKLFNQVQFKQIKKQTSTISGYIPCNFNKVKIQIGINVFHCKKGGYISPEYMCDEHKDCPNDNTDEYFCMCNKDMYNMKKSILCKKLKSRQNISKCTPNYYMDTKGIRNKIIFNPLLNDTKMETSITSESLSKVYFNADKPMNDAFTFDITPKCDWEPGGKSISLTLRKGHNTIHCNYKEIPCMDVNMTCFNITDICLYKLSARNEIIPCKNGGHLEKLFKISM